MRIDESPVSRLPWYLRPLFWLQRRRWGQVLVPALTWARMPRAYLSLLGFQSAFERQDSPLVPALRSLLQVRIAQLVHCAFCIDLNAALLAERSGSFDKAQAVDQWRDSDHFSERERIALAYAEAMTTGAVDDALAARVSGEFGEKAMVELTGLIAFQNMSARFNAALDLPSQGLCRVGGPGANPR